ncbi:radical SAM protein [Serpentinicella sp. ANB-PHB4]|uniref:radical SAM protein n=1 Tax=Serpentinicella sp. ANB-PHB4 TaxID=3074076 RepID=UPI0028596DF5|nr:radical SAM protein [Serpentinicella sp. ANB-PHB4]MDR5659428.1 radical SAM protein [Serpentinicella sp. ANB-PHB4]
MRYEGAVYRPPSEAFSLIIQVTIGCSHNKCTFCSMYKDKHFKIRNLEEIEEDLLLAREHYNHVKRVFLADGDALTLKTEDLKYILKRIQSIFPECERVGIYSGPKDILRKSVEELSELNKLGLGIAYLGIESGSDDILKEINKGVTSEEMIEAGKRIVKSGIKLSVTLISGLGGIANWKEHAMESAKVINGINPDYLGLLTLMVQPGTKMYDQIQNGSIELLSPEEVMVETKLLLENLEVTDCVFRSNHASNYVALQGVLPKDKNNLITQINQVLKQGNGYKGEAFRRL